MPGLKHNWPKLKQRFLSGEWLNLKKMSNYTGVNYATLSTRAEKEGWINQRKQIIAKAETQAVSRILENITKEAERRFVAQLQDTDLLRNFGRNTLKNKKIKGTANSAIAALERASAIEIQLFTGKKDQMLPPDDKGKDAEESRQTASEDAEDLLGRIARIAAGKETLRDHQKPKPK